jgi:small-conductance mechanosensitive channel
MENLVQQFRDWLQVFLADTVASFRSPLFYTQLGIIAAALILALLLSSALKQRIRIFRDAPGDGALRQMRTVVYRSRTLLTPALSILLLGIGVGLAAQAELETRLITIAQGLAGIVFLYLLVSRLVQNQVTKTLLTWIGMPIAVLYVFGWLGPLRDALDNVRPEGIGFDISLYDILRTLIFGALLFWFGALSNTAGKNVIRTRETWNPSTRELAAKLFEITVFFVVFLMVLGLLDIPLGALAVFGGALGIGLGFGLQQIASNFISGIIILLDRSITPGDFVELEDGRSGWLRELNMRFGILETYDGKDIMVPNELFITSSYTNWTHKDKRQRYSLHVQVAYSTDLDLLFGKIREICHAHPKVISDPDLPIEFMPDAEIEGFGESGINVLIEFWMNGIDDGENRVGADLMHSIWNMIRAEGMQIPFPQREIRLLGGSIDLEDRQKA